MIEGGEYNEFFEEVCWISNIFFSDSFDGPGGIGVVFHFAAVDYSK